MDFGKPYTPGRKPTTFQYYTPLVRKHGCNIDHLNVVTTFPNLEVEDNDI